MKNQTDGEKIYPAITAVMGEIGAIEKNRINAIQKYSFRGIDDVYFAVNAALTRHGVFCVPYVEDIQREERQSTKGGILLYTILTMRYTFYASDGSNVVARLIGEAMDSGDKSCNKAMSAAQKYLFLQVFCIPTEEHKDTENETHEVRGKTMEAKIPTAPPQTNHYLKNVAKLEDDSLSLSAVIEKTSAKEGSTGNRKWTLYSVLAGGVWYKTFNKALYDTAVNKTDETVEIVYQETTKGNTLLEINPAGDTNLSDYEDNIPYSEEMTNEPF